MTFINGGEYLFFALAWVIVIIVICAIRSYKKDVKEFKDRMDYQKRVDLEELQQYLNERAQARRKKFHCE